MVDGRGSFGRVLKEVRRVREVREVIGESSHGDGRGGDMQERCGDAGRQRRGNEAMAGTTWLSYTYPVMHTQHERRHWVGSEKENAAD